MDWLGSLVQRADWGDVPTWAATIGAVVAAFFAGWALRIEMRRDAHRQRLEESAKSEQDAAQASTVAVWTSSRLVHEEERKLGDIVMRQAGWRGGVRVRNASDLPVYDAQVTLWRAGAQEAHAFVPVVPPGTADVLERDLQTHTEDFRRRPDGTSHWKWEAYRTEVAFRDASNRRWHRRLDGTLVPLPAAAPPQ